MSWDAFYGLRAWVNAHLPELAEEMRGLSIQECRLVLNKATGLNIQGSANVSQGCAEWLQVLQRTATKLRVKKLHPDAVLPRYATNGAACFDLHAVTDSAPGVQVLHGSPLTVRTGLAFEVPAGHVMLVYSRSGHGFKNNVRLANCVGVVDSDYRGEVLVRLACDDPLYSLDKALTIKHGDRIAQAMLVQVPTVDIELAETLSDTERGAGGFGSTGK